MRVYACITHVPVQVPFPAWMKIIHLGEAQGEGKLNLRDLAPAWVPHHPVIGGMAGCFALRVLLEREFPEATSVGICQYRKFVSRRRLSHQPAAGFHSMDAVTAGQLDAGMLAEAMDPGDTDFLLVPPMRLGKRGLLHQYAGAHHAEDLLRFTSEAVAAGVIAPAESDRFLTEQMLVIGGIELGVFPMRFWREAIAAVETVVRASIERHAVVREGYQRRVWAFCAERLGSYLLLRHLGDQGTRRIDRWRWRLPTHWSRRLVGRLNLVTEEGQARYVNGS